MSSQNRTIIGGVDTHAATHHAAVIDLNGHHLANHQFPASKAGYEALRRWMSDYGTIRSVGVEGTGSYGAGLARSLASHGINVREVPCPNRRSRRQAGKSDLQDAQTAAHTVLADNTTSAPKYGDGAIEAIRAVRVAKLGAVKAKTAATNSLKALIVTAPEELRAQLRGIPSAKLVSTCAAFRTDTKQTSNPMSAMKTSLRSIAKRIQSLTAETKSLHRTLEQLTTTVAPHTSAIFALGPDTVAALITAIGDNPDRLRSEAAMARLAGVAPIPASSGKTIRHRLHRGGNRAANSALHITVVVRLRYDTKTREYMARRTQEGHTKQEIIRCLKRYLVREVFKALKKDYETILTT
ncbi:IS110 family RNA-guided transposase [Arthrobacter sp. TMT4-20]